MYNLGSESGIGSPLGYDLGSASGSSRHSQIHHSLQSLSQVHTPPSTSLPSSLSPLGSESGSRLNLPDLSSSGGAISTGLAPNFSPLLNNLNLKNLNANIQRIIAAKNVLGTGLLNMTPTPNQNSGLPGSQSETNQSATSGASTTIITEVP